MGSLPVSRLLPPQSAHTGGCSASLAIVDGLNEFQRRGELHPPIALLPTQPAGIEIIDVLNGGQQAGRVRLEGRRREDGPTLAAERTSCNAVQITVINMEICKTYRLRLADSSLSSFRGKVFGLFLNFIYQKNVNKRESGHTYPNEDKDEYRDKVISSGDRVFIRQTEEVHDGGTHAQYALDFVSRGLVCIDGPDLRLSGGPGGLLQVYLQSEDKKLKQ